MAQRAHLSSFNHCVIVIGSNKNLYMTYIRSKLIIMSLKKGTSDYYTTTAKQKSGWI